MISNRSNKVATWLVIAFFLFNIVQGHNWNPKSFFPLRGDVQNDSPCESLKGCLGPATPQSAIMKDSLKKAINREANRASLMSAVLPGLGQVYNRKYWKVPLVYAALGGIGYFAFKFNGEYQDYHNELLFRYSHNQQANSFPSSPPKPDDVSYTTDQLVLLKNQSKKYRDLCLIGMGIVYVLNIIDANVDGHLKQFDVNDNLTLQVAPRAMYCMSTRGFAPGISLALHFK